jgi:hypothetical protein
MKLKCLAALVAIVLLAGCSLVMEPETDYGYYQISVTDTASAVMSSGRAAAAAGLAATYNQFSKAVVTIVDANGKLVPNSDVMQLFNLNGSVMTEAVKIAVGTYNITRYFVADSDNNVVFAAPLKGSALAAKVKKPLPLQFTVSSSVTVAVVPEMIAVAGHTAGEFGYTGMSFPAENTYAFPSSSIIKYYTLGTNGIAFDGDDYLSSYMIQNYASNFINMDAKSFSTVDGVMDNGNDIVGGWWSTEASLDKGSWRSGGPGPDNAWFTSDDVIQQTEDWSTPITSGVQYQPIRTNPGPDNKWFTADDVQTAYYRVTNDANGNMTKREYFVGTGTSGTLTDIWFGAYYVNTYPGGNNRYWSWTRQNRYHADGTLKEYVIHEFADQKFPEFFTKEIVYNPQGQVTSYALAVNNK